MTDKPRRPRRIAADEAHAWARNLRLGNSLAKLVLCMVTQYVNGDGVCFVGIGDGQDDSGGLAFDCELSPDTVRKRLAWLEQVGAIARFPQWIDANGRRNGDGKGKRTSDEIRLLINTDPDEIEARAKGDGDIAGDEISPLQNRGLNQGLNPVSPLVAPGQPSDSGKGLISEPEPEKNPPNPPPGGVQEAIDQDLENDISEFMAGYPGPITDLPRLRTVLAAMAPAERRKVLTGVVGYATYIRQCDSRGRSRAVKDAHRWVAGGQWQGYLPAGERATATAQAATVPINSDVGKALEFLHRIARIGKPIGSHGNYFMSRPLSPRGLAFAQAPPESQWLFISDQNPQQCASWQEFIARELAGKALPRLVSDRVRVGQRGFFAPWQWPPLKDGSLCTGPPSTSQEDAEFIRQKQGLG